MRESYGVRQWLELSNGGLLKLVQPLRFSIGLELAFSKNACRIAFKACENSTGGSKVVVAAGEGTEIDGAAETTHLLVRQAVEDFFYATDDECAGAHWARFFRYVESAFMQAPVAEGVCRLRDGKDLRVCRWVVVCAGAVVG